MDHLPLPNDPVHGSLAIPFLCTESYDGGDFRKYPDRKGWSLEAAPTGMAFIHHGQIITDEIQIATFLQTWLYFGFLFEVTKRSVDPTDFREQTANGNVLFKSKTLSSLIGSWSMVTAAQDWSRDAVQLQSWVDEIQSTLLHVRNIVLDVVRSQQGQPTSALLPTCLVIAVLGEYIGQTIDQVCLYRGLDSPARHNWWLATPDCGTILTDLMKRNGWCVNQLTGLQVSEMRSLGMLWFYANMVSPQAHMDHSRCTLEQCLLLQVDLHQYETIHRCETRDCSFQGTPGQALASATIRGAVSLVTIAPSLNSGKVEVVLQDRQEDSTYVAISHVWADGMGNPSANTLPVCVLSDLQNCVNALSTPGAKNAMPFWVDTLCLPRNPLALRKRGLTFLGDAFKYATHVLVIDAYLRNLTVGSMTPAEILGRITVSNWSRRLWTLSEGQMATRVWILFQDRLVEGASIVKQWRDQYYHIPCLPSHDIDNGILINSISAHFSTGEDNDTLWRTIPSLRMALRSRTTSCKFDEAICVSTMMGLGMRKIVETEDEEKMKVLWSLIPAIPVGLVFSTVSQKLPSSGFRWAPSSLMGEVEKSRWGGPGELFGISGAKVTPSGLEVRLPGLLLPASRSEASDRKRGAMFQRFQKTPSLLVFRGTHGNWYRCTAEELWHQDPAIIDATDQEPAVLLDYESTGASPVAKTDFEAIEYRDGLLVTYPRAEIGSAIIHAKAHKHALIAVVSKNDQKLLSGLKECHERVLEAFIEKFRENPDADPRATRTFYLQWAEEYIRRKGLLELEKEIMKMQGVKWTDEEALDICLRRVWYYEDVGPYLDVQEVPASTIWCVD